VPKRMAKSSPGGLIHPSFPAMAIAQSSHLGSQSSTPTIQDMFNKPIKDSYSGDDAPPGVSLHG
jgi:hypothetical protein